MLKTIPRTISHKRYSQFSSISFPFLYYFPTTLLPPELFQVQSVFSKVLNGMPGEKTTLTYTRRIESHIGFAMKIITFLLLVFVLMFNPASAKERRAFHWVDDADNSPLIYCRKDGKPAGIFYEIMTEAFRRLNIPLKVDTYPWARAQKIVADGKADGMITVLTNARKRLFRGSDPILLASEYVFTNKNNPRLKEILSIRSLKELRAFRVVETIGSGWTKENLKGVDITWVPTAENAFNMLIKGRVDIYLANNFSGVAFIKRKIEEGGAFSEGYKNIIGSPHPLKTIAFRLLIRKDSPFVGILDDFNKTIHQMQVDGIIQHILEREHLSR